MRAFTALTITATLVAALAASSAAIETGGTGRRLDGWGPFKFGMTPEEARAVPGVSWRGPNGSRAGAVTGATPANVPIMTSHPITSEYGSDTDVFLGFNGEQKLLMIKLSFTRYGAPPPIARKPSALC